MGYGTLYLYACVSAVLASSVVRLLVDPDNMVSASSTSAVSALFAKRASFLEVSFLYLFTALSPKS